MAEISGPGQDGSMQGQIKTPMSSKNVSNKGDAPVHDYSKAVGNVSQGGAANSIEGPGAKGNWDTQTTIKGSNTKGKY